MKQSLQLKLHQQLTLTPQLQQSIRLLQLSTLELGQEISQMLQDNPLLERLDGEDSFDGPAGETPAAPTPADVRGLRLAVPENMVLDGMDDTVGAAFESALSRLSAAGAHIIRTRFDDFADLPAVNAKGGFAASEAYAWHRSLLAKQGGGYDPRIRVRISRGEHMSAADYIDLLNARTRMIASFDRATAPFDCVLMPSAPIVAPRIADLDDERAYNSINMLILRNTALGNFYDRCAISVPCHRPGDPPVGLMLMGETMGDSRLFSIAAAVEATLQ